MSRIISLKLTCHFPFSTPRFREFRPFSVSWRNGGFRLWWPNCIANRVGNNYAKLKSMVKFVVKPKFVVRSYILLLLTCSEEKYKMTVAFYRVVWFVVIDFVFDFFPERLRLKKLHCWCSSPYPTQSVQYFLRQNLERRVKHMDIFFLHRI